MRLKSNENDHDLYTTRWPTEIPASLIAGTEQGFLPVKDILFARYSPGQEA
jgi:hypothetical protein